jgi:serine/threonine protein kinase
MTPAQTLSELSKGVCIQGYEIISVLGGGKTSLVYKAPDHHLDRPIAIKEHLPTSSARRSRLQVEPLPGKQEQSAQRLMRFVNEARCMSNFRHSVFCEAIQLIQDSGTAYIIRPYYEGNILRKMVRDNWRVRDLGKRCKDGCINFSRIRYPLTGINRSDLFVTFATTKRNFASRFRISKSITALHTN